MQRANWLLVFTVAVALPVYAASLKELEARNQKDTATSQGREYEMKASQAFWGDAGFMRECVPPSAPIAESLTIYFEVKGDGRMGQLEITPQTKVAKCIAKHVQNRAFPKPPSEFVVKIDLNFKK
jgi:hypothetical protein